MHGATIKIVSDMRFMSFVCFLMELGVKVIQWGFYVCARLYSNMRLYFKYIARH
jgi:hypothetical protein